MKYRTLGRTALRVSEVGYGCGNVGGLMVRGSHEEQVAAVKHAMGLGINYFDTAPAYGNGLSETNLGLVIKEIKPDITVATKVGLTADDVKDIPGAVEASLEASLKRLGLDSVDILQLHTPVTPQRGQPGRGWSLGLADVLGNGGVADAFEAVRAKGLVSFLGFTGLGDPASLHQMVKSDRFDLLQSYFNLLNPSAGHAVAAGFKGVNFDRLIDAANQQEMGVVVIRVMAGGALGGTTARSGYASPSVGGALAAGSEYDRDEARAAKLAFLVQGDLETLPQAAVKFALMQPSVSTVLVGYSNTGQIDEAAACSEKQPIPAGSMEKLKELWSTDFGL